MRATFRLTSAILAVFVLNLYVTPCFAAGEGVPRVAASQGEAKVTTNDPQFIPLSEEQVIQKGIQWYWYVLGALAVAGVAAAAGGGGGGGGGGSTTTTTPPASTTGTVTGTW